MLTAKTGCVALFFDKFAIFSPILHFNGRPQITEKKPAYAWSESSPLPPQSQKTPSRAGCRSLTDATACHRRRDFLILAVGRKPVVLCEKPLASALRLVRVGRSGATLESSRDNGLEAANPHLSNRRAPISVHRLDLLRKVVLDHLTSQAEFGRHFIPFQGEPAVQNHEGSDLFLAACRG